MNNLLSQCTDIKIFNFNIKDKKLIQLKENKCNNVICIRPHLSYLQKSFIFFLF